MEQHGRIGHIHRPVHNDSILTLLILNGQLILACLLQYERMGISQLQLMELHGQREHALYTQTLHRLLGMIV